jgi:hypothetical protein
MLAGTAAHYLVAIFRTLPYLALPKTHQGRCRRHGELIVLELHHDPQPGQFPIAHLDHRHSSSL